MKTYDIINAGPKNRFMANGRIVSNSGRIAQPQNFPRIQEWIEPMLDGIRDMVKAGDISSLHMIFDNLSDILSQLLRTTFIAEKGKEFIVLDFSSIESLALACLADEMWRIQFFRDGGDIYKASGAMMFHTTVDKITKDQRQKSKIAELLCGYGGSVGAMEKNNNTIEDLKKRIPLKEIPGIVKNWREANPNIVQLWWDTDAAAKNAIKTGANTILKHGIVFGIKNGNLLMKLPSGRCLVYQKVHLRKFYIAHIPESVLDEETGKVVLKSKNVKVGQVYNQSFAEYNKCLMRLGLKDDGTKPGIRETICFWGQNQTTKKWEVIETYGPKLVENFVQAICRDLLMHSIINIESAGYPVILTVHDELVTENKKGSVTLEEIRSLMLRLPEWCKNWPLRAEGFTWDYYQK